MGYLLILPCIMEGAGNLPVWVVCLCLCGIMTAIVVVS